MNWHQINLESFNKCKNAIIIESKKHIVDLVKACNSMIALYYFWNIEW